MVSPSNTQRDGSPFIRKGSVDAVFDGTTDAVTVAVTDPTVAAGSVIVPSIMTVAGEDSDELELEGIEPAVGAITPGVGFDLIARARGDSSPLGTYRLGFIAW